MANSDKQPGTPSALLSFRFVVPALVGSLTMALVSIFAPAAAQIAVLGGLVSILAGLFLSFMEQDEERERLRHDSLERLSVSSVSGRPPRPL